MTRAEILLQATRDIFNKCYESSVVLDPMCQTSHWDGTECDGYCLLEDINEELEKEALDPNTVLGDKLKEKGWEGHFTEDSEVWKTVIEAMQAYKG